MLGGGLQLGPSLTLPLLSPIPPAPFPAPTSDPLLAEFLNQGFGAQTLKPLIDHYLATFAADVSLVLTTLAATELHLFEACLANYPTANQSTANILDRIGKEVLLQQEQLAPFMVFDDLGDVLLARFPLSVNFPEFVSEPLPVALSRAPALGCSPPKSVTDAGCDTRESADEKSEGHLIQNWATILQQVADPVPLDNLRRVLLQTFQNSYLSRTLESRQVLEGTAPILPLVFVWREEEATKPHPPSDLFILGTKLTLPSSASLTKKVNPLVDLIAFPPTRTSKPVSGGGTLTMETVQMLQEHQFPPYIHLLLQESTHVTVGAWGTLWRAQELERAWALLGTLGAQLAAKSGDPESLKELQVMQQMLSSFIPWWRQTLREMLRFWYDTAALVARDGALWRTQIAAPNPLLTTSAQFTTEITTAVDFSAVTAGWQSAQVARSRAVKSFYQSVESSATAKQWTEPQLEAMYNLPLAPSAHTTSRTSFLWWTEQAASFKHREFPHQALIRGLQTDLIPSMEAAVAANREYLLWLLVARLKLDKLKVELTAEAQTVLQNPDLGKVDKAAIATLASWTGTQARTWFIELFGTSHAALSATTWLNQPPPLKTRIVSTTDRQEFWDQVHKRSFWANTWKPDGVALQLERERSAVEAGQAAARDRWHGAATLETLPIVDLVREPQRLSSFFVLQERRKPLQKGQEMWGPWLWIFDEMGGLEAQLQQQWKVLQTWLTALLLVNVFQFLNARISAGEIPASARVEVAKVTYESMLPFLVPFAAPEAPRSTMPPPDEIRVLAPFLLDPALDAEWEVKTRGWQAAMPRAVAWETWHAWKPQAVVDPNQIGRNQRRRAELSSREALNTLQEQHSAFVGIINKILKRLGFLPLPGSFAEQYLNTAKPTFLIEVVCKLEQNVFVDQE